ncbi:MAG: RtcB family protein [Candidatus Electryonea clarkiae]|nr:RtcB family protein [Candidatus Electryonea clarkiae]MDP8286948.1 RtcB family protein [Candidatus Electryonea clarkiae]
MSNKQIPELQRIDKFKWRIPKDSYGDMRVDGIVYSSSKLISAVENDASLNQVANVATLPGIVGNSLAMPDIHWGYGFPIGGVAAFDMDHGIISPGGVGYDINCGVNLTRTKINKKDIQKVLPSLADILFSNIPCGLGVGGDIRLSHKEVRKLISTGAAWAVKRGYASKNDLEKIEDKGVLDIVDPSFPSEKACERGRNQIGTLGSGNHFLEVQVVDEIFDAHAAQVLGLEKGLITVMIHSGSRGFGYQVCDEQLRKMGQVSAKYGINLVDRQLACAPINSPEGKQYAGAMAAAANFAWVNRLILIHLLNRVFEQFFGQSQVSLGMSLVFDISHNIARFERHEIKGKMKQLCVHRKGATRSFGPGDELTPQPYKSIGQPVLIPGDMGTASYVLVGTSEARSETFGSACHGAGRLLSRKAAMKSTRGRNLRSELESKGIIVRSRGKRTLSEEAPEAYKEVKDVVDSAHGAGIVKKVAKLKPLIVIKG